jgi:hypothetical protein
MAHFRLMLDEGECENPKMNRKHEKKAVETRALAAARSAGVPIPLGEIPGEEPDFTFNAGA